MELEALTKLTQPGYLEDLAKTLVKEAVCARIGRHRLNQQISGALEILELFHATATGRLVIHDLEFKAADEGPTFFDPNGPNYYNYHSGHHCRMIYKITVSPR